MCVHVCAQMEGGFGQARLPGSMCVCAGGGRAGILVGSGAQAVGTEGEGVLNRDVCWGRGACSCSGEDRAQP